MRFSLLASSVAISCCGFVSFSSAQYSQSIGVPTPAPTLQLVQSDDETSQQLGESNEARTTESSSKPSPFDFFPSDRAKPVQQSESASLQSDLVIEESEPATKAVGRRHHASNPADAIISGANAAPGYFAPIDWASAARHTPNPTADYMMREWCVDGLWDNHANEMALECARQSRRIYGGCNHGGQCGVQPGCYQGGFQHVGRYRGGCQHGACSQAQFAAPVGSSGCAHCASTAPRQPTGTQFAQQHPQQYAQQFVQQNAQQYAQQYAGPSVRPMPVNMLPPPATAAAPKQLPAMETGKVANSPANVRR